MKKINCSLCGKEIEQGRENNARPFEGKCCSVCNEKWILPARLGGYKKLIEIFVKYYGMPKDYIVTEEMDEATIYVQCLQAVNYIERTKAEKEEE